jgi:endo-alpha-1,4-polygalactosaminidase (GH114 family)
VYRAKCEKKLNRKLESASQKMKENLKKRKSQLKGIYAIEHDVQMKEIEDRLNAEFAQSRRLIES